MSLVSSNSCVIDNGGVDTIALTVSGSDPFILVMIGTNAASDTVSAVSWGAGTPQPVIRHSLLEPGPGAASRAFSYKLVNPTAGSFLISITSDADTYGRAAAYCFDGINQTTPISAQNWWLDTSAFNPNNVTITVPAGGYAVDIIAVRSGDNTTPVVQNAATAVIADTDWWGIGASAYKQNATQLGWSWTFGATLEVAQLVVALNPASGVTVPDAPTIGTAVVTGSGAVSVNGTANSDGGSPLTTPKFTATSTPESITGTSATLPVPVTGLNPVVEYTFKLKAHNAIDAGYSAESAASNAVTPSGAGSGGGVFSGAIFRSAVIGP